MIDEGDVGAKKITMPDGIRYKSYTYVLFNKTL